MQFVKVSVNPVAEVDINDPDEPDVIFEIVLEVNENDFKLET